MVVLSVSQGIATAIRIHSGLLLLKRSSRMIALQVDRIRQEFLLLLFDYWRGWMLVPLCPFTVIFPTNIHRRSLLIDALRLDRDSFKINSGVWNQHHSNFSNSNNYFHVTLGMTLMAFNLNWLCIFSLDELRWATAEFIARDLIVSRLTLNSWLYPLDAGVLCTVMLVMIPVVSRCFCRIDPTVTVTIGATLTCTFEVCVSYHWGP